MTNIIDMCTIVVGSQFSDYIHGNDDTCQREDVFISLRITAIIQKEEEWYVAKCVENGVASQGKSIEEALENLREAIALFYEDESLTPLLLPTYITTLEVAI